MSATRDKSQKIAFVYSNFYHLYKKGKTAARNANVDASAEAPRKELRLNSVVQTAVDDAKPVVLQVQPPLNGLNGAIMSEPQPQIEVRNYEPIEFMQKRLDNAKKLAHARNVQNKKAADRNREIASLKRNVQQLDGLQKKLNFMLRELEDLLKD